MPTLAPISETSPRMYGATSTSGSSPYWRTPLEVEE